MSATLPSRVPAWAERRWLPRTSPRLEGTPLLTAVLCAVLLVVVAHVVWPQTVPLIALVPVSLLAVTICPIRQVRLVLTVVLAVAAWSVLVTGPDPSRHLPLVASLVVLYAVAASRAHHGAATFAGDRMLGDLRTRLRDMGEIPRLPPGWHAERSFAAAHGDAFAGDFNITSTSRCGRRLEMVLVDVSGKGQTAGTRALVLAGALGGVLGSAIPHRVLPMANDFIERDRWDEGFATALHLSLDLETGEAMVASAGHPPAMHYDAGRGRWVPLEGRRGPALGLLPDADYEQTRTVLGRGDALLVYTDGIIESRARDLDDGIDWMLGAAEARLPQGFAGLAKALVAGGRSGVADDRSAVLFWRD